MVSGNFHLVCRVEDLELSVSALLELAVPCNVDTRDTQE